MDQTTIKATDDGPLVVKGSFSMLDGEGNEYVIARAVMALCRCGHSNNKPFCDGAHAKIGFKDCPRVGRDISPPAKSA